MPCRNKLVRLSMSDIIFLISCLILCRGWPWKLNYKSFKETNALAYYATELKVWENIFFVQKWKQSPTGATTLSITTFGITTLSKTIKNRDTRHKGKQYCSAECLCWVLQMSQLCWVSLGWVSSCWMSWRRPRQCCLWPVAQWSNTRPIIIRLTVRIPPLAPGETGKTSD